MSRIELSEDEYAEALDTARKVAGHKLGDHDEAQLEDVAQEAIVRLLAQDPAPANWQAWLTRVAINLAMDVHRADGKVVLADEFTEAQFDELKAFVSGQQIPTSAAGMMEHEIATITAHLSDRDRQILIAASEGLPPAALAEQFGLASPAVASQTLHRIRKNMRAHLEAIEYERAHPRIY